MKNKWFLFSILVLINIFLFNNITKTYASETDTILEYLDSDEFEQLEKSLDNDYNISFKELIRKIASGNFKDVFEILKQKFLNISLGSILENKNILIQLVAVSIISAVFTNFSNIFIQNYVGETAFYITYLIVFTNLCVSFNLIVDLAKNTIEIILNFMEMLIPIFCTAIIVSTGISSSVIFYDFFIGIVTICHWIILNIIIPLINIYLIVELVSKMDREDKLFKISKLIKDIINLGMKLLVAFALGFNAIQSLIVPAIDETKKTAIQKGIALIPNVGQVFGTLTTTITASGVLIKNSIGVVGMILILCICIIPILKMVVFMFSYRIASALISPVTDKRLLGCMTVISDVSKMLLDAVLTALALFLLSLAIVMMTTNS